MCTGIEIAAIGSALLSAVGTGVSQISQNNQQKAAVKANNAATTAYLDKNRTLAEESRNLFADRMRKEQLAPEDAAKPLAEVRTAEADRLKLADAAIAPLRGSAPRVVKTGAANEAEARSAASADQASALADARSFGDLLFGKGLQSQDSGRKLGLVSGIAGANAALLPSQQQLAQMSVAGKGRGLDLLGSGLGVLGSVGSLAAGSGALDDLFSPAKIAPIRKGSVVAPGALY